MAEKLTQDEQQWGSGVYVYCEAHRNPHLTGWCTVGAEFKRKLESTDHDSAIAECRRLGLPLWGGINTK